MISMQGFHINRFIQSHRDFSLLNSWTFRIKKEALWDEKCFLNKEINLKFENFQHEHEQKFQIKFKNFKYEIRLKKIFAYLAKKNLCVIEWMQINGSVLRSSIMKTLYRYHTLSTMHPNTITCEKSTLKKLESTELIQVDLGWIFYLNFWFIFAWPFCVIEWAKNSVVDIRMTNEYDDYTYNNRIGFRFMPFLQLHYHCIFCLFTFCEISDAFFDFEHLWHTG